MFRFFLIVILCYLLVRFVFGFVIPVVSATLKMRKKMREMQDNANQYNSFQHRGNSTNNRDQSSEKPRSSSGDYIEFEEIK